MPRYRLLLEYDGGPFAGWQRQANGPSVQGAIEDAVFAFCAERVTVIGAGRTDSGVHAAGQVAHLDLTKELLPGRLRDALNNFLRPIPVAVLEATLAPARFDARRSAIGRRYLYRILSRRPPPALGRGRVWWVARALDPKPMQAAASLLLGKHDFTSFRSIQCQANSPLRTLDRLEVERVGDEIHITAEARSFLHNQVRIMAGTLEQVGAGRWKIADVAAALEARDRRAGGPTAPPDGLCLMEVRYADDVLTRE
ncbi:MAG: tRNA pseudouridine(38-40) synthase TruA [Alphaproteobacteria bacterium]|nr:tRNA pseudouridine(38-40) synthase TruA [Alphaproteobacteria bacterium]